VKRSFTRIVVALLLLAPLAATGQALEREVKAAFLFKFLSFVEWPQGAFARPDSPIALGVLGADEVLDELLRIVPGRVVQGRPITVRRLYYGEPASGLHLLFVGRAAGSALPGYAEREGLLLVAEQPGALEHGAIINFVSVDGRVRFEVAADAAERRGLRVSSRMLSVAEYVRGGKP
jgi:hypothetical protein